MTITADSRQKAERIALERVQASVTWARKLREEGG